MCSSSEASSYLRLQDFAYHTTLGSRVVKKKKERVFNGGEKEARAHRERKNRVLNGEGALLSRSQAPSSSGRLHAPPSPATTRCARSPFSLSLSRSLSPRLNGDLIVAARRHGVLRGTRQPIFLRRVRSCKTPCHQPPILRGKENEIKTFLAMTFTTQHVLYQ